MRHRGRPLLRDPRRTRAWPVLDSVVDTALVASFRGHQGVALGTGTVLLLAFLIDLVPATMRSRGVPTRQPGAARRAAR
jgi:hypothetical protein